MKRIYRLVLPLILLFLIVLPVSAIQNDEIRLNLRRNFGFSSGAQIRGTFTLEIVGNPNLTSVTFLLDDMKMVEITQSPFSFTFQTSNYSNGWHDLSALVTTTDQRSLRTAARRVEFVSQEAEAQAITNIVIPILGFLAMLMVIGVISQVVIFQKRGGATLPYGAQREFGVMGGTVCPKCKRAFSIHWWGLNALFGKFDRCDFCGHWSIVRRKSKPELEAALVAEIKMAQPDLPIPTKSEAEKKRETLEDSKYIDS